MPTDRRDFLKMSAAAGAALGLGGIPAAGLSDSGRAPVPAPSQAAPRSLRILILGGTGFIGPFQVRYALSRGHSVTLFNRGRSNPGMFPEVETLIGDRNGQLDALAGQTWDAVIDNSRSNPDWVLLSAEYLRDSVDRYFYVSSRSAYSDLSRVPMNSDAPTFTYETAGIEPGSGEPSPTASPRRSRSGEAQRCVRRPRQHRAPRAHHRPPGTRPTASPTGRCASTGAAKCWPPATGSDTVQIIDVRDLTEWMIRMAETGHTGAYNGIGPATPRPMTELLYGIRAVTTAETTFTWVDTDFLLERGIRPYREMPVWRPPSPGYEGFARFDLTRGGGGRAHVPLAGGHGSRHARVPFLPPPPSAQSNLRAGTTPEQEAEVLAAWHRSGRAG